MSFILLLLEKLPGVALLLGDRWFDIQLGKLKNFERNAAESTLFALVRSWFKTNPGETNPRTRYELIKSEAEIIAELNTFFNLLK